MEDAYVFFKYVVPMSSLVLEFRKCKKKNTFFSRTNPRINMKIAFSISPVNKQWVVIKEVIWNTIRQRLRKRLNGISYYLLQHFQLSIYELLATTLSVMSSGCATREKPWQSLAHEVSWPDVMWLIPNELWKLTSSSRKKKYNLLYMPNFRFIPVYALSKKTHFIYFTFSLSNMNLLNVAHIWPA